MQTMQSGVEQNEAILNRSVDIVLAYVNNNHIQSAELPGLIRVVHTALQQIANAPAGPTEPQFEKPSPSAIRRSITPEGLISFIDGKSYQTLKRHLTKNGLDINGYRARYGLPIDYPSTSSNYSATRAELARSMGLGRKVNRSLKTDAVGADAAPSDEAAPKRRGRPPKAA